MFSCHSMNILSTSRNHVKDVKFGMATSVEISA
mgnify:CR=1 FL=1|jgi:hypothetical protein